MSFALLLLLAAAPAPQSWQFETDGTPQVRVANVEGSISVEGTSGNTVQVQATQEGSEEARARNPVQVEQDGDTVRVRVCCEGSCEKRAWKGCRDTVPTHLVLKVPRGSALEVAAVGAEVKVRGVEGEQELASVSGRIEAQGSQRQLEVASVSGDVVLEPQALGSTEVGTVSGNVQLKLPAGAGARVEFASVSGRFNGRGISLGGTEQTFGPGGPSVEVATVSGSLEVRPTE